MDDGIHSQINSSCTLARAADDSSDSAGSYIHKLAMHAHLPIISFTRATHIRSIYTKTLKYMDTLQTSITTSHGNTAHTDTGPIPPWTKSPSSRSNRCPSWGQSLSLDTLQQLRPPLVNLLPASPQPLLSSLLLPCESSRFCSLFFRHIEPFSFLVLPARKSGNRSSHVYTGK